jgi:hypothetical protein
MRDEYGYRLFKPWETGVSPLYAEDPKQIPFTNDQNQVETRWVVEVKLQANQVVIVPLEFAAKVTVGIISVDATYPP